MGKDRSLRPRDFSWRDTPAFVLAYLILSVLAVGLGLAVEALPSFWQGLLCGVGLGSLGALAVLRPSKTVDVAALPEPSARVRAKCDDPDASLVEAVKAYREETGLGLTEATAAVKAYRGERASRKPPGGVPHLRET
jgi:hypothetical protein